MGDEEDEGPKPNRANIDDEFLRHPHSGAFIRNPFLDKSRSAPILFQEPEFKFNCLEEALADYHCVTVSETGFKELMRQTAQKAIAEKSGDAASSGQGKSGSPLARAALSSLNKLPTGYEFVVNVRKSTYVPRPGRRRQEQKQITGTLVDKLNIEVADDSGPGLRIEDVKEGLIATWNRQHPAFQVRPGDRLLKANMTGSTRASPAEMIEEMEQATDQLKLVVRRAGVERRGSKCST